MLELYFLDSSECKLSGKRKKRREQANKAAMEEQLEIDLEQQALKVVNQTPVIVKPAPLLVSPPAASGKKSQQPVSINLMDFIASPSSKVSLYTCSCLLTTIRNHDEYCSCECILRLERKNCASFFKPSKSGAEKVIL